MRINIDIYKMRIKLCITKQNIFVYNQIILYIIKINAHIVNRDAQHIKCVK